MLEFSIGVIIITGIILLLVKHIQTTQQQKELVSFDKLKHSEKQLEEYKSLSPQERLEKFENLRKAIGRLHSILLQEEGIEYDKQGTLNHDYLYTDIKMLEYYNSEKGLAYLSIDEARLLHDFPKGEFKVIDPLIGKYVQDGAEKISVGIAVDNCLLGICNRWLAEIETIESAIADVKKAESYF